MFVCYFTVFLNLILTAGELILEVKYKADAGDDELLVCLDPAQGGRFTAGLTAKVGNRLKGKGSIMRAISITKIEDIYGYK